MPQTYLESIMFDKKEHTIGAYTPYIIQFPWGLIKPLGKRTPLFDWSSRAHNLGIRTRLKLSVQLP